MKRTTIYFYPGGIVNDNNNDEKVSSYSMIVIIMTFINKYTSNLYHYTTIALPTFFWNTRHTIFSCSGVSITIESWFREPPVERLGADKISFQSRDWILYAIISVQLYTDTENWRLPPVHSILCSMQLFIYSIFQSTRRGIDWEICTTFKTFKI